MYSPTINSRYIWVCLFIGTDLEKLSIASLARQWIICSEWVPSEWECLFQINIFSLHNMLNEVTGVWIIMYLSAVWTLILMAPIHCRGWARDVRHIFSKSVLMKKQTHIHLGWTEGEDISVNYNLFNSFIFYFMNVFQRQQLDDITFNAIRIHSENCHVFSPLTKFNK